MKYFLSKTVLSAIVGSLALTVVPLSAQTFYKMSVSGNKIVDTNGNQWVFKGVNTWDPAYNNDSSDAYFDAIANSGAKLIRIPIHPDAINQSGGVDNALNKVHVYVTKAAARGMYSIIDFHSIGSLAPGYVNFQVAGDWDGYTTTQAQFDEFWQKTCAKYKNDNRVAFYELWNEPLINGWQPLQVHGQAQRAWYQAQINKFRTGTGNGPWDANKILLIGALDWCYQHQLAGGSYTGGNIAYAVHPYPNQNLAWSSYWGYLAATKPVIATEWGWHDADANLSQQAYINQNEGGSYRQDLVNYMDANKVGYTAWSFTTNQYPAMLSANYSFTEFGNFVKNDMLAQNYPETSPSTVTIQAESYTAMSGIGNAGSNIANCDDGDWVRYDNVNLGAGFNRLSVRLATATSNGWAEIRMDSVTGTVIGYLDVDSTGSYSTYQEQSALLTGGTGAHSIYIVFKNNSGIGNFDSFRFDNYAITRQAENYSSMSGVTIAGSVIASCDNGDWICYSNLNLGNGYHNVIASVATSTSNGYVEIRQGSTTGPLLGTIDTVSTGSYSTFQTQKAILTGGTGTQNIYFVFKGSSGVGNFDWFKFY